ncbi:hypothetical protein BDR07DRAFT_1461381 [Suillus spraguei]|nr:hypothetical protein BDR07DRAFT_1461381 [Suillus spraguei]
MSETDTPPPYAPRPTLFSFLRKKKYQTIDLSSHIRHIVSAPNLSPASIVKTANECAATLSPAQFTHLLQEPNIEGHTALYWSIVNHGREAFFALATFVPQFTPACSSTCVGPLNLGRVINSKDESLRRFLGCPPDEAQVCSVAGDTPKKNQFYACFCIRMFQKRLRANPTQELGMEFILGGRIWLLKFCRIKEKWCIGLVFLTIVCRRLYTPLCLLSRHPAGKSRSKTCEYDTQQQDYNCTCRIHREIKMLCLLLLVFGLVDE